MYYSIQEAQCNFSKSEEKKEKNYGRTFVEQDTWSSLKGASLVEVFWFAHCVESKDIWCAHAKWILKCSTRWSPCHHDYGYGSLARKKAAPWQPSRCLSAGVSRMHLKCKIGAWQFHTPGCVSFCKWREHSSFGIHTIHPKRQDSLFALQGHLSDDRREVWWPRQKLNETGKFFSHILPSGQWIWLKQLGAQQ